MLFESQQGSIFSICSVLFSLCSILRKQPSNRHVYFGRRLAKMLKKQHDPHWFDRFVPSPGWILKAWEASEDVILAIGGLDGVVFARTLVVREMSWSSMIPTTTITFRPATLVVLEDGKMYLLCLSVNLNWLKRGKLICIDDLRTRGKKCPAAFVFFKTRYAAACAAKALQSSNSMLWVTHLAPEPHDIYWPNFAIPYRQFWLQRTATFLATAALLVFFMSLLLLCKVWLI